MNKSTLKYILFAFCTVLALASVSSCRSGRGGHGCPSYGKVDPSNNHVNTTSIKSI